MITIRIQGYLSLKNSKEMLSKYTGVRVQSGEDFDGRGLYDYVGKVQFDNDDDALMFMIEASASRPVITDEPFNAGHTPF